MQSFHRLRKLRIDFDPAKSNAALLQRFKCLSVQELELYDISWPSPRTLQLVAQAFPSLRSLKLSQDLVWCNLCNICRFATFKDPPPAEIVYDKIVGLPVRPRIRFSTRHVSHISALGPLCNVPQAAQ